MDHETIAAYERTAAVRCARYRLIMPTELRQFAHGFFLPGQPSADIGCGSGRDVAWLGQQGFPTVGYDASPAMLAEARLAYPGIDVRLDALPELMTVADASVANVLCSALLMHLPQHSLAAAIGALARVLRPGGRLLASYRTGAGGALREPDGRLFTPIVPDQLRALLADAGLHLVHARDEPDPYRSGVQWHTALAERFAAG